MMTDKKRVRRERLTKRVRRHVSRLQEITLDLTPEQYVMCEKAAKRCGMSVSEWLVFTLSDRLGLALRGKVVCCG